MARIEVGEFGDRGREREWLARALRAPRDRAWIADGYVSDRWLPVSPVTGAVDAFEWKAPVDAIGRGDQTLVIEERPEPPMKEIEAGPKALAPAEPPAPKPEPVVEEVQAEASPPPPPPPPAEERSAGAHRGAAAAQAVRSRPATRRSRRGAGRDRREPDLARALARGANPPRLTPYSACTQPLRVVAICTTINLSVQGRWGA